MDIGGLGNNSSQHNEFSVYAFLQTTSQSLKSHVHGMIIFYIIIYFLLEFILNIFVFF